MKITIESSVAAPIAAVWRIFNAPDDILQWDAAETWRTVRASNDLRVGGQLLLRIEASDGGASFDFAATYTRIEWNRLIEYQEANGRMARLEFVENGAGVSICQTFDAESEPSAAEQRAEWQGVLDRFAQYVEAKCGAA